MTAIEDVMTASEAASIAEVTRQRIHQLIRLRKLDVIKLGNTNCILRRSFVEWMEDRSEWKERVAKNKTKRDGTS
jgi:hypothetical protein